MPSATGYSMGIGGKTSTAPLAMIKLTKSQLAHALVASLEAAVDSSDLAQINSVHQIIESEMSHGFDGMIREINYDAVDFILVAAPGFSKALKIATGKSRNEWALLIA